jgi:hypothetical protein
LAVVVVSRRPENNAEDPFTAMGEVCETPVNEEPIPRTIGKA